MRPDWNELLHFLLDEIQRRRRKAEAILLRKWVAVSGVINLIGTRWLLAGNGGHLHPPATGQTGPCDATDATDAITFLIYFSMNSFIYSY